MVRLHEYRYEGGSYKAGVFTDFSREIFYRPVVGTATRSTVWTSSASGATATELEEPDVPEDAVVDRAEFRLTAEPGGQVTLASLGQVRDGPLATQIVVDLGGMTTLAGVSAPGLESYQRWNGVTFQFAGDGEIQTERLLLTFDTAGDADVEDVGAEGEAVLPGIPTALELLVDGTTVWFERQGSTAGLDVPDAGDGVAYAVDRTDAVRDALARTGGPVRVELRALTPGNLTLTPSIAVHRVHRVAFPEGPGRTIVKDAEGALALELPLPDASSGWTVDAVDLVVSATPATERVVPAEGPDPTTDARLRLLPGRMVLARIPDALRVRAATLAGLRLALRGGTDGGEISGRLLAESEESGRPALPVEGGELTPVLVDPGAEAQWVTLRSARPVGVEARWIELGTTYGTVEWELTGVASTDDDQPGAEVHVRKAGGAVRALPVLADIGPVHGSLRLVLEPDANLPIGALTLGFTGEADSDVPFTPGPDGTAARIALEGGVTPTGGVLSLRGSVAAPATYTFADVRVTYREDTP